ncbi:cathepsin O-like [Cydia pomonella]|uniref:cathepsin O-like n=1 Tax=Cydia pomonella TaxID=82600 RepID=UPI002ADD3CBB|nr:cathepsin O-like [Cydia pomonella]
MLTLPYSLHTVFELSCLKMSSKAIVCCASILFFLIFLERNRYLPNNVVINMYFKSEFRGREIVKRKLFADYLKRFNKSYGPDEIHKRFQNFKKSLKKIERLNDGKNDAVFGVTKFSDWSRQELQQMLSPEFRSGCEPIALPCDPCGSKRNWSLAETNDGKMRKSLSTGKTRTFGKRGKGTIKYGKIRKRLDWRERGVVGPVVDQGRCQICWAVAIAGVMASRAAIRSHSYHDLSIQQLIDCSYYHEEDKRECGRGRPLIDVFKFLCTKCTKLATDVDYPFTNVDEKCKHIPGVISLKGFNNECNMQDDETKLVKALNDGPVTALVWSELLFNYDSGVINWHCQAKEDMVKHAVQIVGYDTTSNPPYYIVKNSWGNDWGEEGYVRLAIGGNQCGIAYSIGILEV